MAVKYLERNEEDDTTEAQQNHIRYLERDQYGGSEMEDSVLNRPRKDFNLFSANDRDKAIEGAKIAFMGDEQGNLDASNIPGNVVDGAGNLLAGAAAGATEFAGDIAGVMPSFIGGGTRGKDFLHRSADKIKEEAMDKNSVMGAVGEELGYGAGMGPLVSKGIKYGAPLAANGVGRVVGSIDKAAMNRGKKFIDKVKKESGANARRVYQRNMPGEEYQELHRAGVPGYEASSGYVKYDAANRANAAKQYVADKMMEGHPMAPGNIISRTIEAISPRAGRVVREAGDELIGRIPYQDAAAGRRLERIIEDYQKRKGVNRETALRDIGKKTNGGRANLFNDPIPNLTVSTGQKYADSLDRLLNRVNNRKAVGTIIGINAADSGLEQAENNYLDKLPAEKANQKGRK